MNKYDIHYLIKNHRSLKYKVWRSYREVSPAVDYALSYQALESLLLSLLLPPYQARAPRLEPYSGHGSLTPVNMCCSGHVRSAEAPWTHHSRDDVFGGFGRQIGHRHELSPQGAPQQAAGGG